MSPLSLGSFCGAFVALVGFSAGSGPAFAQEQPSEAQAESCDEETQRRAQALVREADSAESFDQAAELLEQSFEVCPNPRALLLLGTLFERGDRPAEARQAYERLLDRFGSLSICQTCDEARAQLVRLGPVTVETTAPEPEPQGEAAPSTATPPTAEPEAPPMESEGVELRLDSRIDEGMERPRRRWLWWVVGGAILVATAVAVITALLWPGEEGERPLETEWQLQMR